MGGTKRSEPIWEEKVWGLVQHLFQSNEIGISFLQVKKGFRCSRHLHERRANRFIVLSGKIDVWEWSHENDVKHYPNIPERVFRLTPSSLAHDVPAGMPHCFVVHESGFVVEVYTQDGGPVRQNDIVRFDQGAAL